MFEPPVIELYYGKPYRKGDGEFIKPLNISITLTGDGLVLRNAIMYCKIIDNDRLVVYSITNCNDNEIDCVIDHIEGLGGIPLVIDTTREYKTAIWMKQFGFVGSYKHEQAKMDGVGSGEADCQSGEHIFT